MKGLTKNEVYRLAVIIAIQLLLALVHIFRLGQLLDGHLYHLYYGYFSDIVVPFGFYFLLCMNDVRVPFLRPWYAKSALVFAGATTAECLQYFGVYALGVTFDPFDILMYAAGVTLASVIDTHVFTRKFTFWRVDAAPIKKD